MEQPMPGFTLTGEVYEGKRTRVRRAIRAADAQPVILKQLRDEPAPHADVLRLQHEERMLRRAASPGVIAVFGMERSERGHALVLEDFGATSLADLHQRARLDITRVLQVGLQVARALGDIHGAGVVHRDITPSNIVIHPATGQVKIIDFGIASALRAEETRRSNPSLLEGTLAYISPEQTGRMNRAVDHRTDLYSLGITLFELLIGWRPFQADDPLELVHQHLSRPVPEPHELNSAIPRALSAIVTKLVRKGAEDRYQTAEGLVADLQRCLQQWKAEGRIDPFEPGARDASDRLLVPAGLYGRDAERAVLSGCFSRSASGESVLCIIEGEEGSGKTRLVDELAAAVLERQGLIIAGHVDPLRRDTPFAPVVEAFGELGRYLMAATEGEIEAWRTLLRDAAGENARLLTDLVPAMGLLLGPQPAVQDLPPVEARNRFRGVMLDVLHVIATPAHPLVLFLDDLQWADGSTVDLVESLLREGRRRSLLLVSAFRRGDDGAAAVMQRLTAAARTGGVACEAISLGPLNEADLTRYLTDTLSCGHEEAAPLARVIHSRTGGNPHFVTLFLSSLYEAGHLRRDRESGRWMWDPGVLQGTTVTDNVARLLSESLRSYPGATRRMLAIAACDGDEFRLEVIAGVDGITLESANDALWPALRDAIIVPVGGEYRYVHALPEAGSPAPYTPEHFADVRFRFSHDRVRQAALALLPPDELSRTHRAIGMFLYTRSPDHENHDVVFAIAAHLNHGVGQGDDQRTADLRRRMNTLAGERARRASAFSPALSFYAQALGDGTEGGAAGEPAAVRALYCHAAVCAYATGRFAEAERYFATALSRVSDPVERARIHHARVDFYIHTSQREEAIRAAREGLRLVGVTLPRHPGQGAVAGQVLGARLRLRGRRPARLLDAPRMERNEPRVALGILISLMNIAYSESPAFSGFVIGTMMNLTLRHGNADESAYAYAIYGLIVGAGFGDHALGVEFGELSLRLVERTGNVYLRGRCNFLMACLLNHWRRPFGTNLPYLEESYSSAMASGDLHYACYVLTQRTMVAAVSGHPLEGVENDARGFLEFAAGIQYEDITPYFTAVRQFVRTLRGETASALSFDSPEFAEADFQRAIDGSSFAAPRTWYWLLKLEAAVIAEAYPEAVRTAESVQPILYAMTGQVIEPEYWLFTALAVAGLADGERTRRHVRLFRKACTLMERWAKSVPENHLPKALLLRAEAARLRRDTAGAALLYEKAAAAAAAGGFLHCAAMAAERAYRLHRDDGDLFVAQVHRERASALYARWGAAMKARSLESVQPGNVLRAVAAPPGVTTTTETVQGTLDLTTVLKASQAISGELELSRTLERLILVVMENAGATRALYCRVDGSGIIPEAEGVAGPATGVRIVPAGATAPPLPFAESIARYVARSGESVMLDGGGRDPRFASDPYLRTAAPPSVLCLPVVRHGAVTGLLYLENGLVAGAFTSRHREVLELLTGQIAISLENARLYEKERDLARMREEIRMAAHIQAGLLPRETPELAGYAMAGRNIPAQEVGGDYFDFVPMEAGGLAVCLGDVSGKGLPASLLMANLQATLRSQVLLSADPAECLARANTLLFRSTSPEKFATLFLGVLDPRRHTFAYGCAGHEHPLIIAADGGVRTLSGGGPPLAMLEAFPYPAAVEALEPGDIVAIYSDGVTEAMDADGTLFGHERLHGCLREHRDRAPRALLEATLAAVAAHTGGAPQSDDITLVILRRNA